MKNKVFLVLSIFVTIIGIVLNISGTLGKPITAINLAVSLIVLCFYIIFIFQCRESRNLMLYSTAFWEVTFVISILGLIGSNAFTESVLNVLLIPLMIVASPLYGFRYWIEGANGILGFIVGISLVLGVLSYLLLKPQNNKVS